MAGSKPRSESLKERSIRASRRCVAVSEEYSLDNVKPADDSEATGEMTFKFGAVTRRNRKTVFGVISDVTTTVSSGAGAFCENVSDILKSTKEKREEQKKDKKEVVTPVVSEVSSDADIKKTKEEKNSTDCTEQAETKVFGEVVRKKENDKKTYNFDGAGFFAKLKETASANKKAAGVAVACFLVICTAAFTFANFTFAYCADIDGKTIIVRDKEQLRAVVSDINDHITASFGSEAPLVSVEEIGLEKKIVKKGAIMENDAVSGVIMAANSELYDMYVIYAGETAIVGLATEEEAKAVISGFENYYTGGDASVTFSTDKELKCVFEKAPLALMMSDINAAVLRLNGGEKQENVYTVEDGDTVWDIASKFDSSVDEILALNNMGEEDILNIGDEILVSAYVPAVNVTTTQVVSRTVEIPYETKTVQDNSQYNTWSEITVAGVSGSAQVTEEIVKVNGKVSQTNELSREVISEPVTQVRTVGTKEPPKGIGTGKFITPARGYISSRYGSRGRGFHTGLDIAGSYGSAVCAADDGKVIFVGWSGGYGNLVKIDHQNGYVTYYAHNSGFAVKVGQTVEKGQTIAYMGSTGNSTGNHCHFEILKNGSTVNPENYI